MLSDADEYVKAFEGFRDSPTPSLRRTFDIVSKMAQSPQTVLICGETGTGKEVVARAVHELSATENDRRYGRNRPFVSINCATFPPDLVDAELFGHVKGAFTGAGAARDGVFKRADGGTLFLDEIGEFPLSFQAKLLRVLDNLEITPVGGAAPQKVQTRVVAATNRNLEADVREGRFRQDLFHRLAAIQVTLPPLRDRTDEEILGIARYYVRQNTPAGEKKHLSVQAQARIAAHPWPGNVRELENTIAWAVLMSDGEEIGVNDLGIEKETDIGISATDREQTAEDRLVLINWLVERDVRDVRAKGKDRERLVGGIYLRAIQMALSVCGNDPGRASEALGVTQRELQEEIESLSRFRNSTLPIGAPPARKLLSEACIRP